MSYLHYVLTGNNWNAQLLEDFQEHARLYCKYAVVGREVATTTQTPHLQGYMSLKKKTRFTTVIKRLPGFHIAAARDSAEQNTKYCTKEDKDAWVSLWIYEPVFIMDNEWDEINDTSW